MGEGTKTLEESIYKIIKLKRFYNNIEDLKNDLNTDNVLRKVKEGDEHLEILKKVEKKYGSLYDFLRHYIDPGNVSSKELFKVVKERQGLSEQ